jgi:membrane-bound lytic murein transglycosylase B
LNRAHVACFVLCSWIAWPAQALDVKRPEVREFIDRMAAEQNFDKRRLRHLFAQVEIRQSIIDAMSRPAEKVTPWFEYRDRFLTEARILKGADFWQRHAQNMSKVAASGVSPSLIAGILGVETQFGELTGRYRVIDALSTLAFDYPPRSGYFLAELQQFLLLTREEAIDPKLAMGSYAGAMGAAQFMPRSYREFAVDGDDDGHRDLWRSWDDIVQSIANYLLRHGWRTNEQVLATATVPPEALPKIDTSVLALNETVESLRAKGVRFNTDLAPNAPALLVISQGKDGPEYRVGFNNFYVITRYNRSPMYAMAVHDLGMAIEALVHENSH